MGWLFSESWPTRKVMREHLCEGNGLKTIASCWKGNNLWAIHEYTYDQGPNAGETVQFIALYLIRWHGGDLKGWGYKDMDESAGPCYYNCPISYLDKIPDPGGYATEWRKKVREQRAMSLRKFAPGQRVRLYGKEYKVGDKRPRTGGYYLWDYDNQYRITRSQVKHVEVL